jgi:hypothetical protein
MECVKKKSVDKRVGGMQGGLGTAGMHPDVNERKEKSNNQKINNSMEPNIQSNDSWNRWSRSITQFASALLALVNDSSATSCPSISSSSSSHTRTIPSSLFPWNQPFFYLFLHYVESYKSSASQHVMLLYTFI